MPATKLCEVTEKDATSGAAFMYLEVVFAT